MKETPVPYDHVVITETVRMTVTTVTTPRRRRRPKYVITPKRALALITLVAAVITIVDTLRPEPWVYFLPLSLMPMALALALVPRWRP